MICSHSTMQHMGTEFAVSAALIEVGPILNKQPRFLAKAILLWGCWQSIDIGPARLETPQPILTAGDNSESWLKQRRAIGCKSASHPLPAP